MTVELEKVYRRLKTLKIQGATAVAQAIAENLILYIQKRQGRLKFKKAADYLLSARPTEAMAQNGVDYILAPLAATPSSQRKEVIQKKGREFSQITEKTKEAIARNGVKLIQSSSVVFTHCHSSSVEGVLKKAKEGGNKFEVINTETRPLFQGRITAKNLLKSGIPVTMIVDSAGASFLSWYPKKIDVLMVGADAVLQDGSTVNKIGSYGLSLAAAQNGVPVYVAASLLKYAFSEIEIERRGPEEIWPNPPVGLEIINLAFDEIPADYIKGFVTEAGIIKPKDFSKKALELYPWLNERKI
jgi:ribose 1,5-bisphosphate isomerase